MAAAEYRQQAGGPAAGGGDVLVLADVDLPYTSADRDAGECRRIARFESGLGKCGPLEGAEQDRDRRKRGYDNPMGGEPERHFQVLELRVRAREAPEFR